METHARQLAVCLPSHQPDVCLCFSFSERFTATWKNVCVYNTACSPDGHLYPITSQKILEVDL